MVKEIHVTSNALDMINARTIYLMAELENASQINSFNSYNITSDYIYIKAKEAISN